MQGSSLPIRPSGASLEVGWRPTRKASCSWFPFDLCASKPPTYSNLGRKNIVNYNAQEQGTQAAGIEDQFAHM